MFYRLALTSSLLLCSAFPLDSAALAQSVDIPFNGTVPVQATFSSPVFGTAEPTISGSSVGISTQLESQTPATVGVQSSTPATITVSPPQFVSGPTNDPPGTTYIGFLNFGSTSVRSDVGGGIAALPAGSTDLEVSMLVERPDSFPPGTYTYAVILTITP